MKLRRKCVEFKKESEMKLDDKCAYEQEMTKYDMENANQSITNLQSKEPKEKQDNVSIFM